MRAIESSNVMQCKDFANQAQRVVMEFSALEHGFG